MSDWTDAVDPVPPRRAMSEAEKQRHVQRCARRRQRTDKMNPKIDALSSACIDPDFEDVGFDR